MPRTKNVKEDLDVLNQLADVVPPLVEPDEESDDDIEVKIPINPKKKKVYNVKPKDPDAPKKPRTEKQIAAWALVVAKREENRNKRMNESANEKKLYDEHLEQVKLSTKQKMENKIVNKAISIKKKAIRKEQLLDDISDDETPIEEIKQMVTRQKRTKPVSVPAVPVKPDIRFY